MRPTSEGPEGDGQEEGTGEVSEAFGLSGNVRMLPKKHAMHDCAPHLASKKRCVAEGKCQKCREPWPCEVAALTTRLAEETAAHNATRLGLANWSDRAEAAETRLAEVERAHQLCREGRDALFEKAARISRDWESAEQLLSEMAEGLRREGHRGDGTAHPNGYLGVQPCRGCALLAKYDASRSEKGTEHRKCYYEANADYCAVHGKRGPHCAVCRDTWPCAETR